MALRNGVNAIKDVAGGNFIQLLGLDEIMQLDKGAVLDKTEEGTGVRTFDILAASAVALGMMAFILLTLLVFVVLLVFRIVVLWILVVLSPIAFLFGGAQEVVGGSIKAYDETNQLV